MDERGLFISTMRHPEMRLLRAALWDLKWEHGIDWTSITSLEITPQQPPYTDCWMLETGNHLSICYWPQDEKPEFTVVRLHDASDPLCECDYCREARICHVHLKHQYIAHQTQELAS